LTAYEIASFSVVFSHTESLHRSIAISTTEVTTLAGESLARSVHYILDEAKAEDILIYDLREVSAMSDFFVIATGTSPSHVRALVERVKRGLREQKIRPIHNEGEATYNWVLLDYFDVVVHIFREPVRRYYNIEKLWGDAPHLDPVKAKSAE